MNGSLTNDFSISEARLAPTQLVIAVRGSVDMFGAPELKRRLVEAIDQGVREIVLDLSDAVFLDSTGLGAVLTAHKRLDALGGRLVVVWADSLVGRVFEVTGLDSILNFATSREEAVAGLEAAAGGG